MTEKKWELVACHDCSGHGLVSSYTFDGGDFQGADECDTCMGSGRLWCSPKGALANWPGGRFVGRMSVTSTESQP